MEQYQLLERIGSGSYSVVWKAVERLTGKHFAVKELLDSSLEWSAVQRLPEVTAARVLPPHENLLRLHAVHRVGGRVFMVMDFCWGSLLDVLTQGGRPGGGVGGGGGGGGGAATPGGVAAGLPEPQVRHIMRKLLSALAAVHSAGFMHRDLKPENVLLGGNGSGGSGSGGGCSPLVGDFGQLRSTTSFSSPTLNNLTPYVSTRWYRAPEVLLRSPAYGPPVDVWALGVLMIELFTGRPAFPGVSEVDQLFKICAVLGHPNGGGGGRGGGGAGAAAAAAAWPEGEALARAIGMNLSNVPPRGVASLLPPSASPSAVRAVSALLAWNPAHRPSAEGALGCLDFFTGGGAEAPIRPPGSSSSSSLSPLSSTSGGGGGGGGGEEAKAKGEAVARQKALDEALGKGVGRGGGGGGKEDEDEDGEGKEGKEGKDDDDDDDEGGGGKVSEKSPSSSRPLLSIKPLPAPTPTTSVSGITAGTAALRLNPSLAAISSTSSSRPNPAVGAPSSGGGGVGVGKGGPNPQRAVGGMVFGGTAGAGAAAAAADSPSPPSGPKRKSVYDDDAVSSDEEQEGGGGGYRPSGLGEASP